MSLQFSRSVRSLEVDSYRTARVGLIFAIIIAVALLAWFLLARVTVYEISSDVQYLGEGRVAAMFQSEPRKRIQPGQSAVLRINTLGDGGVITMPALVVDVDRQNNLVEFLVFTDESTLTALEIEPELNGQVEVEVEYVTPASLVRRASGTYLNNTEFPVSPQSLEDTNQ
ncbi:MAG: hypothetical protein R3335_15295 [Anaerolineales bacterium]|nr:hypothetical protein [Anaerolineales bacterium]